MKYNFSQENASSLMDEETLIKSPMSCPHCFRQMNPDYIGTVIVHYEQINRLTRKVAILKCTYKDCLKPIMKYYEESSVGTNAGLHFKYRELPLNYSKEVKTDLPKNIQKLSPNFVNNYKETLLAKEYCLNELIGMGYRKSIEFLIKDFVLKTNQAENQKINKMPLKNVITDYLTSNEKLQTLGLACAYLGNDFTHYERRNLDKDIEDLERFLKLLVSYISNELTFAEADIFVNP